MSQDDTLRLVAEVVDKFSGPLKSLRSQLQAMGPGPGVKSLHDGFAGVEKTAANAAKTVSGVLNPALATVGVTSLTAVGAMAAVANAVRGFSSATSGLVMLSRETGVAVDKLRELEALGAKVGIGSDAMDASVRNFAGKAREIQKGIGDVSGFLQSQNPVIARWGRQLQLDLQRGLDPAEAYTRALKFMQAIQNPIEKGMFAEKVLGNGALSTLSFEDVDKMLAGIRERLGKLPKDAGERARAFELAVGNIRDSLHGLRDELGYEISPPITEALQALDRTLNNPDVRKEGARVLKEAITEIRAALSGLNVKDLGADIITVLKEIGTTAHDTATAIRAAATALHVLQDFKNGNFSDGFKKLGELDRMTDLGIGERKNAEPSKKASALDEQLDAQMRGQSAGRRDTPEQLGEAQRQADNLRSNKARVDEIEARSAEIRRRLGNFDAMAVAGPVSEAARKQADALRTEMEKLTAELKRLREQRATEKVEGATAQKSAFDAGDGTGPFGGAKIQTASYGGGGGAYGAMGAVGRGMHGYGGGRPYMGGLGGLPGMGASGGRSGGEGGTPGARIRGALRGDPEAPDLGDGIRGKPFGKGGLSLRPGGPGERVGRALRGEPNDGMPDPGANPGPYKAILDHIADSEGTINRPQSSGYNTSLGYGKFLPDGKEMKLTDMTLDQISDLGRYMRRQPGNPNSSALGRYQIVGDTMRRLMRKLGLKGTDKFDEKTQDRMAAELVRGRGASPSGLRQEWASLVGERNRRAVELAGEIPRGASTVPGDRPAGTASAGSQDGGSVSARIGERLRGEAQRPDGAPEPTDGRGVNADLMRTIKRAQELSEVPFHVHEGMRDIERQADMVRRGWSKTMDSEHIKGRAVDLRADGDPAVGKLDQAKYAKIADAMRRASQETGIPVEWGGDWKGFKDIPHFQLPKAYKSKAGPYAGDPPREAKAHPTSLKLDPERLAGLSATRDRLAVDQKAGGFSDRVDAMKRHANRAELGFKPDPRSDLLGRAVRSGMVGATPRTDAHGRVDVHIEKPGPDTRVKASTNGTLFKETRLNRGVAMARASEVG